MKPCKHEFADDKVKVCMRCRKTINRDSLEDLTAIAKMYAEAHRPEVIYRNPESFPNCETCKKRLYFDLGKKKFFCNAGHGYREPDHELDVIQRLSEAYHENRIEIELSKPPTGILGTSSTGPC